ncbi:hypothetical protein P4K49_17805 [Bacillus cereus]|uniref:Uncharacterized protein n=2 Tax=Bacillus cereus group TaxID=86661 RepID=A0A9X7BE72_BACCE|nr:MULTISPECIES: hypothetical protein [Bacillus]EJQ89431.1 hypothetical protein IGO_01927 [Bacillus toyonensis]EOP43476.1 hypothetical protein IKI_01366 [Bacillus toyonensis]KAB5650016.1 hypothetical protein E8M24_14365 [Bacillus thuringiensis]KNH39638.1 hypothetical protein ACS75_15820 [Bacillus thuringiensis]MBG0965237.1 hypothetical protein [Bacillus sp. SRB1LM]
MVLSNVQYTAHANNDSKDATEYVNALAYISSFLLAYSDQKVIDKLLTQSNEKETELINGILSGLQLRLSEN